MEQLYECHITLPPPATAEERTRLEAMARNYHFKTSQIDGDPVLGAKVFFYLTGHDTEFNSMKGRMDDLSLRVAAAGVKVLRCKIEQILYDDRFVEGELV